MDKEQLKKLIQDIYDDYDFVEFNLHFVDEVQPHMVYEIKNNRINNKLKETTMVSTNFVVLKKESESMLLCGIDTKDYFLRRMIEASADKILTDFYEVDIEDCFLTHKKPVEMELTITNWDFCEEKLPDRFIYKLRFEVA